jgi:hypothetical protein
MLMEEEKVLADSMTISHHYIDNSINELLSDHKN